MKSQKITLNRCENYLFNKRIGKKYSRGWFVIIKKLTINHSSLGDGGEKTKILGDDSQEIIGIPWQIIIIITPFVGDKFYCILSSVKYKLFFLQSINFFLLGKG